MTDDIALENLISGATLQRQAELQTEFKAAKPFRHVVIDEFLAPSFCADVVAQFPVFDESTALNENGEVGGKSTQERVRELGPAYQQLDDLVQSDSFLSLIGEITGIDDLAYDPHYFGGGTHENRHGQDLDPHIDFNYHPVTRQHRRLNLIIYLNEEWRDEWGGSIQFHRNPYLDPTDDEIKTVTPLMNRCVIFETNEYSWHGFERINLPAGRQELSRKSFALYYYTDTRPANERAEEHSTVYVERHLPARFQPGMQLSDEDLRQVRTLLARRDQHLKRLYRYIQSLYGTINQLKSAPTAAGKGKKPVAANRSNSGRESDHQPTDLAIAHLKQRIDELESSTSWRITAPIRALKRLVKGR